MRVLLRFIGFLAFVAAAWLLASPAEAAEIEVNTTRDVVNGARDGISLREAFDAVNSNRGADEIILADGATYELTLCGDQDEDDNGSGDLDHSDGGALTITGRGATIAQKCQGERVIESLSVHAPVTLDDVDVTGGSARGLRVRDARSIGGGVMVGGSLHLRDAAVHHNQADGGAGGVLARSATLERSTVHDNASLFYGGGIVADSVNLSASTVAENTAGYGGGGIYGQRGGLEHRSLTMVESTVRDNTAGFAGGIMTLADVEITRSTVSGNVGRTSAAGIMSDGYVPLPLGGSRLALVTVTNSTISGNVVLGSANTAETAGGGITAKSVVLRYATVADNQASHGANVFTHTLEPFGSVVAGAIGGTDCSGPRVRGGAHVDVRTDSGGYNFDGDGSCGLDADNNDIVAGGDPRLEPLGDNGGPTQTRLPAVGMLPRFASPLLNAIPQGVDACEGADQRGTARPQRTGCEIGAVELAPVVTGPRLDLVGDCIWMWCAASGPPQPFSWKTGDRFERLPGWESVPAPQPKPGLKPTPVSKKFSYSSHTGK